jgi:hypothetical protein
MRRLLVSLMFVALAVPAVADVRPMPRPAAIMAFAGASDLALRTSPRPLRSPDIVPERAAMVITMTPDDLARRLAQEPVAPAPVVFPVIAGLLPVDPPLRAAVVARATVTVSASNAPQMPDAAAAMRAAFVAVPGPVLHPRVRPAEGQVTPVALIIAPRLRPAARPPLARPEPVVAAPVPQTAPVVTLALVTPRPLKRPADLFRRAAKAVEPEAEIIKTAAVRVNPGEQLVKPKKGSVCGDRRIRGETLAPIPARVKGCGLADPVRVNEVDGVRLSPAATIDCTTAKALKSWISGALKPAAGRRGVAEIKVAASYACRTRNNIRGAKISEHGRGKAIDIAAVVLGNGQVLDVLHDYRRDAGKMLRVAHKAACGIFGTTLGPGSDGYHENHLHFDTASYRGGAYCR